MNRIRYASRSALFWVSFVGIVAATVLGAWWSLMLAPEFGQEEIQYSHCPGVSGRCLHCDGRLVELHHGGTDVLR